LKKTRDAEGAAIAADVQKLLNMEEGKINKRNEAWLETGDAGVISSDNTTKILNEQHKTAQKLIKGS
jgi:hypothetical protein